MLSPYENIIIGNFLYSVGLAMERKPRSVEASINPTQQTPLDKALGDVVLQLPGAWRLLARKRLHVLSVTLIGCTLGVALYFKG